MTPMEFKEEFGDSTTRVVLLGMVTFGIYYFIWLAERRKPMNRLAEKEIYDKNMLIFTAVFGGLTSILAPLNVAGVEILIVWFNVAYSVLMIVMAWKIGVWLEQYSFYQWGIKLKASRFLLVIFNIFYVNYLINRIAELDAQQKGVY